jgi:hypothetical protein
MESAARKYSRQMDGLEYLVHTGPSPQYLLGTPNGADQFENSADSSLLSEPFSEYAPLEDFPETGLQGQLTKFSPQFQATMQEIRTLNESDAIPASSKKAVKNERINWEKVCLLLLITINYILYFSLIVIYSFFGFALQTKSLFVFC